MTQNNQKITFELKHGYYTIIEMGDENKSLHKLDLVGETFEKSLVYAYEMIESIGMGDEAKIVHLGNYDTERKMKAGN